MENNILNNVTNHEQIGNSSNDSIIVVNENLIDMEEQENRNNNNDAPDVIAESDNDEEQDELEYMRSKAKMPRLDPEEATEKNKKASTTELDVLDEEVTI